LAVSERKHIAIVGSGIAGLAAAYRLQQTAPGLAITLIESNNRLGGKITTDRVDGFVIEGGPDTFLSYKPRGLGLCKELGLEDRLHGTNEKIRCTYVMRGSKLYELPEGLTGLIPSRFGPMIKTGLISPLGKLRMGLDYFIPPRSPDGDESLADFVGRRLGRELYDRMIEPLMSGIYAGDGEQLSLAATFPQLRDTELKYGSLVKGMLAAKRKPAPPRSDPLTGAGGANPRAPGTGRKWAAFLTLTTGLAEIVEALETKLTGVDIRLGRSVVSIGHVWRSSLRANVTYTLILDSGESLQADGVILATPAYVTADLVSKLDPEMASALRAIPYSSTATVSVAYPLSDVPRPLDGYGYVIPSAEGHDILACTWTSSKFPHRAPEGYGLIRAFIGRAGQESALEKTDEELVRLVRDELRAVLGITAGPLLHRVFRWPKAMPQYTLGHLDRLAVIDKRLAEHPGLYLAGNGYRGIGIPDCIASGEAAATQALTFIKTLTERIPA
jgi:oxygen-dependent protoporphyrinogen oxidase